MSETISLLTREYSFRIPLSESEANRFEDFVEKTGIKKVAFVRKAVVEYLDHHEKDAS